MLPLRRKMTILLKGRRVPIIRKIQRRDGLYTKANGLLSNLEEGERSSGRTLWKSTFDLFLEGLIHFFQKYQLELKKNFFLVPLFGICLLNLW